jgi:GTPase SAR1 family protein
VVGNTGAGKSSMINALLDEERLVPTNCMRACTAVVTEISYNTETEHPYRAQIEFITAEDWEMELRALFQDLFDECGEMKNVSRDTDAVAWAKIKAVYPQKTKEAISTATVEQLVQDNHVKPILGKTKVLEASNSSAFYRHLQRYVDSQEKAKKDDKTPREMEYWPLIRVVKLSVKSPVLQTGAVVVDLPGVHDANAARAAVADSYMQKCTGLWIVAPITRAVDDKTAHKLLGEGFRRLVVLIVTTVIYFMT